MPAMGYRLFAGFTLALPMLAQEAQQGTITGFVFDASHAPIPHAEVTVTSRATGQSRAEKTADSGLFTFAAFDPGVYNLRTAASGFKTGVRNGITVDTGATVRVDFAMEVGAAAESITVNADASVINTETGESASLITAEQVSEL